jgi:hypothetical protein
VLSDAVPLTLRSNDGQRPVGYFYLADRELYVYVIGTAGQRDPLIKPGEIVIEAYEGLAKTPTYRATLKQRRAATVGDLTITFERELQFTGLRVVRDPAVPIIWLACALIILGPVLSFYFPHRRLWARVSSSEAGAQVTFAGAGKEMAPHLAGIVQRLKATLPDANLRVIVAPAHTPTTRAPRNGKAGSNGQVARARGSNGARPTTKETHTNAGTTEPVRDGAARSQAWK